MSSFEPKNHTKRTITTATTANTIRKKLKKAPDAAEPEVNHLKSTPAAVAITTNKRIRNVTAEIVTSQPKLSAAAEVSTETARSEDIFTTIKHKNKDSPTKSAPNSVSVATLKSDEDNEEQLFTVPAKRIKRDGTLEETFTTHRILQLYKKLADCISSISRDERNVESFLNCFNEDKCSGAELKEVLHLVFYVDLDRSDVIVLIEDEQKLKQQQSKRYWYPSTTNSLIFRACGELPFRKDLKMSLKVLKMLLDANSNALFAKLPENVGSPFVHNMIFDVPYEALKMLVNAEPATLLQKNGQGELPIHMALKKQPRCKTRDELVSIAQLLCTSDDKKKILETKNGGFGTPGPCRGLTPLQVACYDFRYFDHPELHVSALHPAYKVLAEETIDLLPNNTPAARLDRLHGLIKKNQQLQKAIDDNNESWYRKTYYQKSINHDISSCFVNLFYKTITEIEELNQEILPLIALAVWKGEELPSDQEERHARWITCGAQQIVNGVAPYLGGTDPSALLQEEYDRLMK